VQSATTRTIAAHIFRTRAAAADSSRNEHGRAAKHNETSSTFAKQRNSCNALNGFGMGIKLKATWRENGVFVVCVEMYELHGHRGRKCHMSATAA
jgi:hypothetical protein